MKIIAISDFHGILPEITITFDLLLICGDVSPFDIQGRKDKMKEWFKCNFKSWVTELNCDKIIMIPGNHDFYLESLDNKLKRKKFEDQFFGKLRCLWNEYYEYNYNEDDENKILKIFGTPYCHIFGSWPFMRDTRTLIKKFNEIPENLDILLTHDPAFSLGNTDVIMRPKYESQAHFNHVGNVQLKNRLFWLHDQDGLPKYCFNGHIHTGDHHFNEFLGMKYANVSLMDEYCNELIYNPLIFNI